MEAFEYLTSLFSDFSNPKKRIFVGYLALSLFIAFAWLLLVKRQTLSGTLTKLFDKNVFLSKSAFADYKIFLINGIIGLIISPLLLTQIAVATALFYFFHHQSLLSASLWSQTPKSIVVGLFSITMFLADDFSKYLLHRWMHRFPVLWAIHKVHHSAETMTPITVYRVHPLEGVFYSFRGAISQGIVISLFIYLFGNSVDLFTILGVNILVFIFHVTGSNLRHSHISIHYWPWLEHLLISPAQHQLHHSIAEKHFDKNFGAALAVWDWLFGSLHTSEKDDDLTFGLQPHEMTSYRLVELYVRPVVEMYKAIRRRIRKYGTWILSLKIKP